MSDSFNVIGDIAGNYKTLMALIAKMPKGKVISVGDIVDRGPRSKEVIEYFMNADKTGEAECLMGNHEHMMIDYFRNIRSVERSALREYSYGIWQMNGGTTTLNSFNSNVPESVLSFLETRKIDLTLDIGEKKFYISHAFLPKGRQLEEGETDTFRKVWNRQEPFFNTESPDVQICGHNSQFGLRYWNGIDGKKAICIDTSRNNVLTGIHLPTLTIYQQEYID